MEAVQDLGISFILWLQSLGDWLTPLMKLSTFLGNEEFYLLIVPVIYWCIDRELGIRLGLFLMTNGLLNSAFKIAFHAPRPYWVDPNLPALSSETSFGLPSGHAQNGVVVWGTLASAIRRKWAWVVAILIMFILGMSRIYLGVHFPSDVLAGWLLGAILLFIFMRLEKPVRGLLKQWSIGQQVLVVFLVSLAMLGLVLIIRASLGSCTVPEEWVKNAQAAFPDEDPINPLGIHNFTSNAGVFFGLSTGAILIASMGGYRMKGTAKELLLRYVIGVVGVFIIWQGLGMLFPRSQDFLAYALRYIRYALVGGWISFFAPWLFRRLGLA